MKTIVALLLTTSLASAQTVEERLDALESNVQSLQSTISELGCRVTDIEDRLDPHPTPAVPSTWYDAMGVPIYLVGHEFNVWAVKDGSWNDPATWNTDRVPTKADAVVVTQGISVSLDGVVQAKTILAYGGNLTVHDGADITVSTIMGVNGAKWTAGTEESPIGYTLETFGTDFEADDSSQIGNGFIWHGHGLFSQHGHAVADDGTHQWYSSNGVRGDAHYTIGPPAESVAAVDLDSNSIQWRWDGTGNAPHGMIMHGSGDMAFTTIRWPGRTDKSRILNDTDNLLARYCWHFHRGGEEHVSTLNHCIFATAVGWGCDNHSSNVEASYCAAVDCYGGGLMCEAANEAGFWKHCVAIGMHSNEKVHTYERQQANDRWYEGVGIVGAARVSITDCTVADCGIGIGYNNKALHQTIGGVEVLLPYDDGTLTEEATQSPLQRTKVFGAERFGMWNHWVQFKRGIPAPMEDCEFTQTGTAPGSAVMLTSYGDCWDCKRCVFTGPIGSLEQNIAPSGHMLFDDCTFNCVWANDAKPGASMHTTEWRGGTITASEVGVRAVASTHSDCVRRYLITDTTIDSPTPLELVFDPPYSQYTNANQINEVFQNGVPILYPWQE